MTGPALGPLVVTALLAAAGPAGPVQAGERPPALVFGMTPVVGVEATRTRFDPLAAHMADKLGRPVQLVVTETYGELIDQVAAGRVDLVKFSPLAYVRARERIPGLQLIATQVANGSVDYSSYLVALQDNPHSTQQRLAGARLCFADPDSTSGYLFPLAWLKRRGLDPQRDFASVTFGGSHRACLAGLFEGRFDVTATWAGALRDARSAQLGVGELVIVAKTGRIPYDAWCLRPGLEPALAERVRTVLLETNTLNRTGRQVLSSALGINGWVPVSDRTYDGIRRVQAEVHRPGPGKTRPAKSIAPERDSDTMVRGSASGNRSMP